MSDYSEYEDADGHASARDKKMDRRLAERAMRGKGGPVNEVKRGIAKRGRKAAIDLKAFKGEVE